MNTSTSKISMIINVNGNETLSVQPVFPDDTICIYKVSLTEYLLKIEDENLKLKPYIPLNLVDVLERENNKIQFVGIPFSEVDTWKKFFTDSLFVNLLKKCNNPII